METKKVHISYSKHNRTLFSCSSKEDLVDQDKWSQIATEEGWGLDVDVNSDDGEKICECAADRWGGINLKLDIYSDEIKALSDKYLILKGECWGGGNSIEAGDGDNEDGLYEVEDLNFRPNTVRLGLIEDIINDAGDIISIGDFTGLQYDIPEETSSYYEIQNEELVEIEYDEDTNSWEEA